MKDSSPDINKENASMVGSSLTESKQDRENCDDPGNSSYKENEESYPIRAEEQDRPFDGIGSLSTSRNEKPDTTRYFVIKSLSHHNIQLSIEKGIWATQVMNEPILEEAFHNSSRVILIFSVNMSGFFQGYAQMMSSVGWRRENVWSESNGGSNPWGRTFNVKWLRLNNLPFQKTLHLKNPLNDYKPVKISRDCQELSEDVGEALCRLIDGNIDVDGKLKRNSDFRDEFLLKRPCREIAVPLQDEDYASVSSSNMAWARAPILYPSLLYQQSMLADSHNAQKMHGMSSGVSLPDHLPTHLEVPNVSQMKHSRVRGNSINRRDKRDPVLQLNKKDLSDERSPLADSMSEEDILDMEEHQGSIRKSLPAFHQFVMPSHVPCTLFHNYRHMKNTSGPVAEAMWHLPIWQQQDHHGRCRDHRWLQRMMTMGTPNI
ncbi:uncharacterized protein LOC131233838 isoform X2 [Magnolia sinica]|uniref:uncharacterized protein LOC131233838 isoform X2 n=1 Tax=Magnolia sinica TaxID=86752 RepID=UPI00265A710A|nr:uncharacterized protein LOC131233838 isoform X2 [Magnolia sinica]